MSIIKKKLGLKQYQRTILPNVLTSQFLYSRLQDVPRIKRLRLNIQTKKSKNIHFLYLWLFTGKKPHSRKFNPSWKHSISNPLLKTKAKASRLQVAVRRKKICFLTHQILFQIISKQISQEKRVWRFQGRYIQAVIPAIPLTKATVFLQAKNSFFPNIPLTLHVQCSNATAFQKLFILRALKILSSEQKIKKLDMIDTI